MTRFPNHPRIPTLDRGIVEVDCLIKSEDFPYRVSEPMLEQVLLPTFCRYRYVFHCDVPTFASEAPACKVANAIERGIAAS